MISLSHLNKLGQFLIFFSILVFNSALAIAAVDIWKQDNQNIEDNEESDIEENENAQSLSDRLSILASEKISEIIEKRG